MTSLLMSWTAWLATLLRLDDPEARGHVGRELLLPAPLHLRLDGHGLERFDAGDALDQERLVLRAAAELLVETLAEYRRQPSRRSRCRTGSERARRRSASANSTNITAMKTNVKNRSMTRVSAEPVMNLADVLKLAHAGDRVADPARLEIGDRQRDEMAEQPGPELDVDAVGRVREQIGAQGAENRLE